MYVQIDPFEVVQLTHQLEDLRPQRGCQLKWRRPSIFVHLPNLVTRVLSRLRDFYLDKLRHATFEHPAIRENSHARRSAQRNPRIRKRTQQKQYAHKKQPTSSDRFRFHCTIGPRLTMPRSADAAGVPEALAVLPASARSIPKRLSS